MFTLGALAAEEIEGHLARLRTDWNARQRALVARLSEGAIGRALSFDLEGYVAARSQALVMLKSALSGERSQRVVQEPRRVSGRAPMAARKSTTCCGLCICCSKI